MSSIEITPEYGLIIRKLSLTERSVSLNQLLETMQTSTALSEDEYLISFGPSFGQEALNTFRKRLEALGLVYWNDFCEFSGDYPFWCGFRAQYRAKQD
jgi:hypothetical protein